MDLVNTITVARLMARGVAPWTAHEASQQRAASFRDLVHDHKDLRLIRPASERDLTSDNCAACQLEMVGRRAKLTGHEPPNHSNWLRIRIQTGGAIPGAWFESVMNEAETDNPAYYGAVLRDIATYGIREYIRPGLVVER